MKTQHLNAMSELLRAGAERPCAGLTETLCLEGVFPSRRYLTALLEQEALAIAKLEVLVSWLEPP